MKSTGNTIVIDRAIAETIPVPNMGYNKPGRKPKEESAFGAYDANRAAIRKLRARKFTWAQIHHVLKQFGIPHSYPSLILWKNEAAREFNDPHPEAKAERKAEEARPKRGRPPGSVNGVHRAVVKKAARRGRPPGSKNKPKVEAVAPKRRGRPPGSKNKVKA